MTCKRCHGLLVEDQCYDLLDDTFNLKAWRCISCGNLIDPVILKNQQEQEARLATPGRVARPVGASVA
jgi:hypothetical protein